ncbi:uncharacterized protein LOC128961495 [Oppia nitens]|uniref:uncharacterized protein LOC128961495 n=1 Tax=Oppia nitens TaxID=1686743 RepID=UPI0023DAECD8|nr:uncharacterized protein LOC128961495 [Oppia nitens]
MNTDIVVYIYAILVIQMTNKVEMKENISIPKFCETTHFTAMFYRGDTLVIGTQMSNHYWYWNYSQTIGSFQDPPYYHSIGWKYYTAIFIFNTKCPNDEIKDPNQCGDYVNANECSIERQQFNSKDTTKIYIVMDGNRKEMHKDDYPWKLTPETISNIWPKEWTKQSDVPQSSIFIPYKNQVLFITHSGNKELSAIHSNSIYSLNWFENMKKDFIESDVTFVGMFREYYDITYYEIYAIGDRGHDRDNVTKIYKLVDDGKTKKFQLQPNNLRKYFGCNNINDTDSTNDTDNHYKEDHSFTNNSNESLFSKHSSLIIIIFTLFISLILLSLIIYVIIKFTVKPNSKTVVQSSYNSSGNVLDRGTSVQTIDSQTGRQR